MAILRRGRSTPTTLSGLPADASGRIAWRYYVPTNAGPSGNNSNYIGIDTVEYVGSPTAVTLTGLVAGEAQSPLSSPAALPMAALPAVSGLALAAAYLLRRKR